MLEENVLSVGWPELPDLTSADSVEALAGEYRTTYPDARETRVASHAAQIFDFIRTARPGDLVIMPLSSRPAAAIGEVSGEYAHRSDLGTGMAHTRPVTWLKRGVPRERLEAPLVESFEGFLTFSRVAPEVDEQAVRAVASDPSVPEVPYHAPAAPAAPREPRTPRLGTGRGADASRAARDQIHEALGRKFRGAELGRLVRAVLVAHGFVPAPLSGRSGGDVEFVASAGPLGFGPRVLVRVSSSGRLSADAMGDLQQAVEAAGATQGLLVTWGHRDLGGDSAGDAAVTLRHWDSAEIVDAFLDGYERLADEIRNQVPLRKIWALATSR